MADQTEKPGALERSAGRLKMADIARMAGVSVSSVSRALAGSPLIPQAQRDKINAIAREHGYVVNQAARNLRLQTTQTIGLVLPHGGDKAHAISDPFLLEMIGGLADEVVKRGFDLLLSKVKDSGDGWLRALTGSHRFDGLLVIGQSDQHKTLNEVAKTYPAMVVWGEKLPGQSYCTVGVDNCLGGYLATRHMISGGCRDILYVGPRGVPESEARFSGYVRALNSTPDRMGEPRAIEAPLQARGAAEVVSQLLREGRAFDGLFCASDLVALGALTALEAAGRRVPQDVAVCGFDDVAMARSLTPPLTTVSQDRSEGARHMVELLFRRMSGHDSPSVLMTPQLIVRQSTRAI